MPQHQLITGIGIALFLAGGIPAAIGTERAELFVLYGVLMVAGALIAGYGKKLGDRR